MNRSLAARLGAAGLLATLTACGAGGTSPVASTTAPPGASHATIEDLADAIVARKAADGSYKAVSTSIMVVNGEVASDATSTTEARNGLAGLTMRTRTHDSAARTPLTETELLVFPDGAYVSVRPEGEGPYHLLDPAATDLLSLLVSQTVATARDGRRFCGTEYGRSTLTGVTPGELDGQPVSRYVLTVDLGSDSAIPTLSEFYRKLGLTALHPVIEVDPSDRLLRCTLDEELPAGSGWLRSEMRFSRFGEPVVIERPATGQITTTPPS